MANCKVVNPITNVCGDLLQASGNDKDFYVGYVSDLGTRISLAQTGAISSLSFQAYLGLVKFEGFKNSNVFTHELVKGPGGSISYKHTGLVKLMPLSTQDDVEVQRLTQAQDMFIISLDNNENAFIYGASKGLTALPGVLRTTGAGQGEDITTTINFEGFEKTVPLRFSLGTTTSAMIAYLDGLVR